MDHNIGGAYGGLRQENDAHRAHHPGDGQHDGGFAAVVHGQADVFFSERMLLKNLLARHSEAGALMLVERIYEYAPVSMVVPWGALRFVSISICRGGF